MNERLHQLELELNNLVHILYRDKMLGVEEHARARLEFDELNLEYRERTGRDYIGKMLERIGESSRGVL